MKKKVLLSLVLLTIIGASTVFAQTLNGIWRSPSGNVFSYFDNKAVFTEVNNNLWKEAEKRGTIGIGSLATRNLRSTGNLTWSGQDVTINRDYTVSWNNCTITLSPDGQTFELRVTGIQGSNTYTKVTGFELTGIWRSPSGNVFSYFDNKAVFTEVNNNLWKEAEKKGTIGIGSLATRNLRSTDNLTWSGQDVTINRDYTISWNNCTITLSPDGQTFELRVTGIQGSNTYTRVQL